MSRFLATKRCLASVVLAAWLTLFCAPFAAYAEPVQEKRVALVVGVEVYGDPDKNLPNAVRDSRTVRDRLIPLGFDVVYQENLKPEAVSATLAQFRSRLTPGAVALVYYSGHGMQIAGRNFLLLRMPRNRQEEPALEEVRSDSLVVDDLVKLLRESKTQLNILLFDACRDSLRGIRATGLAEVNAPVGTVIGFATYPGGYSYDLSGVDVNSLYTKFLAPDLAKVNVTVEQMLKGVGKAVYDYSRKNAGPGEKPQQPWMQSSLYEDFFLNSAVPKKLLGNEKGDLELWYSVKDSSDPRPIRDYLQTYPGGQFAPQAKKRLAGLERDTPPPLAALAPLPPSTLATVEKEKGVEHLLNSPVFLDEIDEYLKRSNDPISELSGAVDHGDVLAKAWWCALATHERYRVGTRAEQEIKHCQAVEAKGYHIGKFLMGRAYLFGRGVPANVQKGRELLEKAAKAGNPVAQNLMGDLLFEGGILREDVARAVKLYRAAAAAGNYHAQNNLGVAYLRGRGVPKDPYDARSWFKKAAAKGDPWAQVNLGALFLSGKGGIGDTDEGYAWIRKSAEQGNAQAWLLIGKIFEEGIGRGVDSSEAAMSYRKVIEQSGDQELIAVARRSLERLGFPKPEP